MQFATARLKYSTLVERQTMGAAWANIKNNCPTSTLLKFSEPHRLL